MSEIPEKTVEELPEDGRKKEDEDLKEQDPNKKDDKGKTTPLPSPPTPPPNGQEEGRGPTQTIRDSKFNANEQYISGVYNELCENNYFQSDVENISQEDFATFKELRSLQETLEPMVEGQEVREFAERLERQRVLILTGEARLGKGVMAQQVARRLWETQKDQIRKTLLADRIGHKVRVNFNRIAKDSDHYGDSILIFEDVFATGNTYLRGFGDSLDLSRLRALREALKAQGSYLIFTSENNRLPENLGAKGHLEVVVEVVAEVRGLSKEHLVRLLYRKAEEVLDRERSNGEERERARALLKTESTRLVEACASPSVVVDFLNRYLLSWVRDPEAFDLDLALRRVDDLGEWLLEELAQEPEVWSFAIALILAHGAPHLQGVPWMQFFGLWQRVDIYLDEKLRRKKKRKLRALGVDGHYLRCVRAEVYRQSFPRSDLLRFIEPSYSQDLWRVLLDQGRGTVSLLHPLLRDLLAEPDAYLREVGARALGRLGELDPGYLVLPLVYELAKASEPEQHLVLGKVFQGVLGSVRPDSDDYLEGCLSVLRRETSREVVKGAWVRVFCIREMAACDLPLAIRELRLIVQERMIDKAKVLTAIHRQLGELEAPVRNEAVAADASQIVEQEHQLTLVFIASQIFPEKERKVIDALLYGIVGLCFVTDPVEVLGRLTAWFSEVDSGLPAALALLFLDHNGIADRLQRKVSFKGAGEAQVPRVSLLLVSAITGEDATEPLSIFLQRVYGTFRKFPNPFRGRLRQRFSKLLHSWAKEAVAVPIALPVVEQLLASLLNARNKGLQKEIFLLLRSRDFERSEGLTRLARLVETRAA